MKRGRRARALCDKLGPAKVHASRPSSRLASFEAGSIDDRQMLNDRLKKRVAVLISGRGSNMASLIEAAKSCSYPAEITVVVTNRPDAAGLTRAQDAGIATAVIDHTIFGEQREAFEQAVHAVLQQHQIEIVCLA